MKIGVDAFSLTTPTTGIGRYVYEILSRAIPMGHEWVLYTNREIIHKDLLDFENVTCAPIGPLSRRIPRLIWTEVFLPWHASLDGIDAYWSPAHRFPLFLPNDLLKILTIHDLTWNFYPETMKYFSYLLEKYLMPRSVNIADGIICVSKNTLLDLQKVIPKSIGKAVPILLGARQIEYPSKINVNQLGINQKYCLFVGTIEPRKNLISLLSAYALLTPELKHSFLLVIVGGRGWGSVDISSLILDLNISSSVKVLGYVSDEILETLYANAEFLVMPSLYEGFGLPLVEAMKYGVASLTSNCSSMPEVVGNAGLLVNPLSVDSIRMGLISMMTSPSMRNILQKKCLERAKLFDWAGAASNTVFYIEELVKRKRL